MGANMVAKVRSGLPVIKLALLLPLMAAVVGCRGTAPSAGVVQVRNVSASAITFEIDSPSQGMFPGIDRLVLVLDPWSPGLCPSTRIGVDAGAITVTISGPGVHGTQSHSWTTSYVGQTGEVDLNVLVDATGTVTFGGPIPPAVSCQSDPVRTPRT
jgi:hypothetical protein